MNTTSEATIRTLENGSQETEVSVTLGNETRAITIGRYTPSHCWYSQAPIVVQYATGTVLHVDRNPQVVCKAGKWVFPTQKAFGRKGNAYPVRFAVEGDGSGWN